MLIFALIFYKVGLLHIFGGGKNVFIDIVVRTNCVYIKMFFMLYLLHMFNKTLVY